MPDRISYMLDSMCRAVDEGFSYDGIVSIPETGLEDMEPRGLRRGGGAALFKPSKIAFLQGATSSYRVLSRSKSKPNSGSNDAGGDFSDIGRSTETLVEPARMPRVEDDEMDMVYGCFQGFSLHGAKSAMRTRVNYPKDDRRKAESLLPIHRAGVPTPKCEVLDWEFVQHLDAIEKESDHPDQKMLFREFKGSAQPSELNHCQTSLLRKMEDTN